jgi:hypothetical protein
VENVTGTTGAADSAAHSVLAVLGPGGAGAQLFFPIVIFGMSISAAVSRCIMQRWHGRRD